MIGNNYPSLMTSPEFISLNSLRKQVRKPCVIQQTSPFLQLLYLFRFPLYTHTGLAGEINKGSIPQPYIMHFIAALGCLSPTRRSYRF